MLFSKEEIDQLHYLKAIVSSLNDTFNFFKNNSENSLIFNNKIIDKESFFGELKTNILYLDNLLFNIVTPEVVQIINNYLHTMLKSLNDIFLRFLSGKSNVQVFLNDYFSIFYRFFVKVNNKSLFGSGFNINYSTSSDFEHYVGFFKRLLDSYMSDDYLDKDLVNRFLILENKVNGLMEQNVINANIFNEKTNQFIFEQKNIYDERVNKIIIDFHNELNKIHSEFIISIKDDAEKLERSIKSTDADFKATYKDYDILKKMVQGKGEQEVTDHYKRKAIWERVVYWIMTFLTFFVIYKSIGLAMNSLEEYKVKTSTPIAELIQTYKDQPADKIEKIFEAQQKNALTYLILRLALSILLFSTIIYTSRVAYRAYIHMRHSENMRLKLATLKPFINQFEDDERNQVHKDLIPDYFGKDAGFIDVQGEKFKDLPTNISAVAMKAIEQISAGKSNASTEKNGKKSDSGAE